MIKSFTRKRYTHKDPGKRENQYISKSQRSEHCALCKKATFKQLSYYRCELCAEVVSGGWCREFASKNNIKKCKNTLCTWYDSKWEDGCLESNDPAGCPNHSVNTLQTEKKVL